MWACQTGPLAPRICSSRRTTPFPLGLAPSVAPSSAKSKTVRAANPMPMEFESLDGYLLYGTPSKAEVVRDLLQRRPEAPGAAPFYEGIQRLGARTPDLSLIALRLVLAGKKADDAAVVRLRDVVERARSGDAAARAEYAALDRA